MAGRNERLSTATGRSRKPDLRRHYAFRLPEISPSTIDFRVTLLRGNGIAPLPLDSVIETIDWADEADTVTLSGSASLRRPVPSDPASLPIGRGHRLRLAVRWNEKWHRLWDMRVLPPEINLEDGQVSVEFADEMEALKRSRRDWIFRKSKSRPKGWKPEQIALNVLRKTGVRPGSIAKTNVYIDRLRKKDTNAWDVISEAYQKETNKSGRDYLIRMRDGRFDVLERRRNPVAFVIGQDAIGVSVRQIPAQQKPFTVLTGTGRVGKGKDAKKVRYTEGPKAIVARFGYVHRVKSYGTVSSLSALKGLVRRDLAKAIKVKREATVTVPLIPFIRRGDALFLEFPKEGFRGRDTVCFAASVRHSVGGTDPSSRTTEIDVVQTDVYQRYRDEVEKKLRAKKRTKRKKR